MVRWVFRDTDSTSKFTQEVRLASAGHRQLEWIVGGFYTHEASVDREAFTTKNAAGQPVANDLLTYESPTTYQEYAAFGDVTYHFTDTFDVSGAFATRATIKQRMRRPPASFGASYPLPSVRVKAYSRICECRYHFSGYSTGTHATQPATVRAAESAGVQFRDGNPGGAPDLSAGSAEEL